MTRSLIGAAILIRVLLIALLVALMVGCATPEPTPMAPEPMPVKTAKPTFTPLPLPTITPLPEPTNTPDMIEPTQMPLPPTPLPTATLDPNVSPLTGKAVSDPSLLNRRVLAVRVGNDAVIRPQDGLSQADIVYEEIMEGWTLTRFTALYLDHDPERIRPLRSARLSSLAIAPQYDAALVHSGASDEIRWRIAQASFVDLDQYFHAEPYGVLDGYDWRGRMYTSGEAVHQYLRQNGLERDSAIEGYSFSAEPVQGDIAEKIHIPYPDLCIVDWEYSSDQGVYSRFVQGEPHLDGMTGEQLTADNVILLYAEHKKTDIVEDSLGSTAIDIVLEGQGHAQICRNGVVVEAEWRRVASDRPIQYYGDSGELIPLKPGQTWIQLVPTDYEVQIEGK